MRQFHVQFPTEREARTFVHLMANGYRDVAILRQAETVTVIDGGQTDRRTLFLALAMRVAEP